jgi:hypothetical protein
MVGFILDRKYKNRKYVKGRQTPFCLWNSSCGVVNAMVGKFGSQATWECVDGVIGMNIVHIAAGSQVRTWSYGPFVGYRNVSIDTCF